MPRKNSVLGGWLGKVDFAKNGLSFRKMQSTTIGTKLLPDGLLVLDNELKHVMRYRTGKIVP